MSNYWTYIAHFMLRYPGKQLSHASTWHLNEEGFRMRRYENNLTWRNAMFRKIGMLMLVFFSAHALANHVTMRASETKNNETTPWSIATQDDGYYQILGPQDHKKFIVYVSPFHEGKPSDTITLDCNAGDGYQTHLVPAGATIVCYPDFKDIIPIYIDQFQNGSEGTFTYEPYTTPNMN